MRLAMLALGTMTAGCAASAAPSDLLVCGAARGFSLHLYDPGGIGRGHCGRLLGRCLRGTVTGLSIDTAAGLLAAGTSRAFLLGYELDGNLLSSRVFDEGMAHLVP